MNYLKDAARAQTSTPQSQPIPGRSDQVENSAGGFVWAVDNWTRLNRFLILGSEGGSYYAGESQLTRENAGAVLDCIKEDGPRTVSVICDISKDGRAPKNDQAIFALALCASAEDDNTRRLAFDAMPEVCRIGTHLFQFASFFLQVRGTSGFSSGAQRSLGNWYTQKEADQLAYQIIKYRQREGWTHRDILRMIKLRGDDENEAVNDLLRYVTKVETHGGASLETIREHVFKRSGKIPSIVEGFELAQGAETPAATAELVRDYNLPREALKTEHLNSPEVWEAMLYHGGKHGMPIGALVRNLSNMTRSGLLDNMSAATSKVAEMLTTEDLLRHARIHPLNVLIAARTYAAGFSLRGSNRWTPVPRIIDALDEAFYLAFGNVEPTGKRRLIALDISGSMWGGMINGVPGFTPAEAAGAMAMVSIATGDPYEVVAFTSGGSGGLWRGGLYGSRMGGRQAPAQVYPGLSSMSLSKRQRLDDVDHAMSEMSRYMGGTDCALPMLYADKAGKQFDIIEVYTDSETWAGDIHPAQALVQYRQHQSVDAKLAIIAMVSNGFSIADPKDAGMLDVVGFDTATPALLSAFASGGF